MCYIPSKKKKKKYVLQPWNEKLMQTQLSSIQLAEPTDYVKHNILIKEDSSIVHDFLHYR